jgi:hypothetical protein
MSGHSPEGGGDFEVIAFARDRSKDVVNVVVEIVAVAPSLATAILFSFLPGSHTYKPQTGRSEAAHGH